MLERRINLWFCKRTRKGLNEMLGNKVYVINHINHNLKATPCFHKYKITMSFKLDRKFIPFPLKQNSNKSRPFKLAIYGKSKERFSRAFPTIWLVIMVIKVQFSRCILVIKLYRCPSL